MPLMQGLTIKDPQFFFISEKQIEAKEAEEYQSDVKHSEKKASPAEYKTQQSRDTIFDEDDDDAEEMEEYMQGLDDILPLLNRQQQQEEQK